MKWVVVQRVCPLGTWFTSYLRSPRRDGCETWVSRAEHALAFGSFLEAAWQALRHFPALPRPFTGETVPERMVDDAL